MNLRPPGYEPDELPSCSTPRHSVAFIGDIDYYTLFQQFCQEGAESFFAAEAEDENAAADLLSRKPAATPIHAPPRGATKRGVGNEAPARFQFTPLREGRPDGMLRRAGWAHFNSRPSARGDASCTLQIVSLTRFQFTPLREGRQGLQLFQESLKHFNSRPSARGDSASQYNPRIIDKFQFTPLREGRHRSAINGTADYPFQFTPLREGRQAVGAMPTYRAYFNSRPSARGDVDRGGARRNRRVISIHAPPRGATLHEKRGKLSGLISIHAPPRGATADVHAGRGKVTDFNSRPSARGDVGFPSLSKSSLSFQFTPLREGRRWQVLGVYLSVHISIHAPPRGATCGRQGSYGHIR